MILGPQVTACIVLATASLFLGYWAGAQSRRSVNDVIPHGKNTTSENENDSDDSDASSANGDVGNPAALSVDQAEECKLVRVVYPMLKIIYP